MRHDASWPFVDDSSCFLALPDTMRLPNKSWVVVLSECFGLGNCTKLLDMDCFVYINALFLASKPSIHVDNVFKWF